MLPEHPQVHLPWKVHDFSYTCVTCYQCRWDIVLLYSLPPQGIFDMQNLIDSMGIYSMRKSWFLRSEWWYIHISTYTRRQDLEVASSLFTYFDSLSSSSYGAIYISLEIHFMLSSTNFRLQRLVQYSWR